MSTKAARKLQRAKWENLEAGKVRNDKQPRKGNLVWVLGCVWG